MKRISALIIAAALALSFFPAFVLASTANDPFITDLIAGQHTVVGSIKIWNDADFIYVKYETISPYCLMETHLAIASDLSGIPQANGNPIPGQFPYQTSHNCATSFL